MTDVTGGGFDAVILAGGRARRMGGVDKPAEVVAGRSLIGWTADAVTGAGRLVVVGPPRPEPAGAVFVREDPPGGGPVPALRAGLAEVAAPWTVLLAADLPFLRAGQVTELRRAAAGHGTGAVLVDGDGRPQWLIGCWSTGRLRAALDGYAGGSLRGLMEPLGPAEVGAAAGERPPWYDCDTPESLGRARRIAEGRMLEEWIEAVCRELGLDREQIDRDLVLDLARDVAHGVARPAAPLTAYLLGLAVGRGDAARDAAARITDLAESWADRPAARS
ncbi:NTP transferase domain-containing protein [Thermomonospora amylolytica]|uniref:NTP transferase domain-containing protein n=1 Tax=Thermomonospora amylolytica TaxID=1411117 RepID=UPI002D7742DE|nr:NTP transferase domain-containing protein [Thermomonospora amylolytica]